MSVPTPAPPVPTAFGEVKGWFSAYDQALFEWFLTRQNRDADQRGDLLELGAYMGKSAIFLGQYLRDGEEFTVCDLFDSAAPDDANLAEMQGSYSTLTRRAFEANYQAFHEALPTVIQAPTSVVADKVRAASCRFVHVDASHLYEHVAEDVKTSRLVAAPGAVVVFDDYRAWHCPGVAAAVWGAVASGDLHVICISQMKLYATWDDPEPLQSELRTWLESREGVWHGVETVAGRPLVRIGDKGFAAPEPPKPLHPAAPAPAAAVPAPATATAPAPASAPATASARVSPPPARKPTAGWRALAKDLLPPLLTRAIVARRKRRR
ncbi:MULTISPECIES: class I SAM-dependent methyltransferase [unclassified Streptomyces]|uniref:class I SAM-dependent methyltransferase n=1 Tax=unclassified Streptomyces TaxID=2593676 RepID=UPI001BE5D6D7|nr:MULTISPECIES: class I SAM-dependent methyltransferase [unclassified Streptomyces]MBT2404211.1 class I SAM-dependent methyltransferase [Streptomyces sp. ISL-21]MBT2612888.1 class I SAM-dependent methyltransferase [Streptomyces sp. ISL-87]